MHESNVDGKGKQGYNKENNGGENYDDSQAERHRENWDRSNQSNSKGHRFGKEGWKEDKAEFIKRHHSVSKEKVIIETDVKGKIFAYTQAKPDGSSAYKAVEYLNNIGVKTICCDGIMVSNDGKTTTTHPEAVTAPDGTIYINKYSNIKPEGIAVHEGTPHYTILKKQNKNTLKFYLKLVILKNR